MTLIVVRSSAAVAPRAGRAKEALQSARRVTKILDGNERTRQSAARWEGGSSLPVARPVWVCIWLNSRVCRSSGKTSC